MRDIRAIYTIAPTCNRRLASALRPEPDAGEQGLLARRADADPTSRRARAGRRADRSRADRRRHADVRGSDGEFDAVVAMYHDQGHIALKLLGMHRAVNITLGSTDRAD